MSWTEQRRSSEFVMGQNKEISLLPMKQQDSKCMPFHVKKSVPSFYFCELLYDLDVFYDQYLTSWNLALCSTNIQLSPCYKKHCLSAMTILWYYHLFSFPSIVKAESSDWVCRLGCVIIANKS